VRIELQPFTLVGATTRLGLLTTPLRDRFGIPTRLEFYTVDELYEIVVRNARCSARRPSPKGAREIASGRADAADRRAAVRRVVDFASWKATGA
jgi:Holliday junction DNA helicase RuvB